MSTFDKIKELPAKLLKRVSKNSNAKQASAGSVNSKYSPYLSILDRNDTSISYNLGRKILRDTQVGAGYDILKYLLSSKDYILTNTEEDNSEIYDFIKDMFQNMETKPQTIVKQMVSAIMWGYSVHEKLYDLNEDNRIIIKKAVPIHIKTLQNEPFDCDENGELKNIHQVSGVDEVDIPADKVLRYTFSSLYDELEGHGLLYYFLPVVEDKENLMDWLMTFAERNGSPTMYGKTENAQSRNEMLNAFDDIAAGTTGLVVGVNDELGVIESAHKGEIFFSGLQYNDNKIFRRMYIGNLLLGDNSQTGTYAQSQTQLEFGSMIFDGILDEIAEVFQTQMIDPIVQLNFGVKAKSPKFSFDKFTSGDMQKLFSILQPLMQSGVVDGENSAVQESLALLFKAEAGVEYTNETPEMDSLNEDFNLNDVPVEVTDPEYGQAGIITLFDEVK